MNVPTVDILLPFHSFDTYLDVAIQSVLASEGVSVHLILIDDRPTDKSDDIHKRYPEATLLKTYGIGYYSALNAGQLYLKSDYVGTMNSDDIISPNKLTKQIEKLDKTHSDLCVTHIRKFSGSRGLLSKLGANYSDTFQPEYLLMGSYFADATWVATRDCWEKYISFGTEKMGDWALALKIFLKLRIIVEPTTHYWYRKHNMQVTSNIDFHKSAGSEIYPNWLFLSEMLGWPELNRNSFGLIASPLSLTDNLTSEDICKTIAWLFELMNHTDKNLSRLARRRYLYACVGYLRLLRFNQLKFRILFRASGELILEYLTSKRKLPSYMGNLKK